jgi:hypothetical protein
MAPSQPGGPMAIWPIFCVARFSRTGSKYDRRSHLENRPIADGGMPPTYETMLWCTKSEAGLVALSSK